MEKTIKKMMVAGLACLAMCGTAMAAPKGPQAGRAPEPKRMAQQSPKPAQKAPVAAPRVAAPDGRPAVGGYPVRKAQPAPQIVHQKPAPKPVMTHRPAAKPVLHTRPPQHHVAHHKPARRPVTPCHRHHRHECTDCHYDDNGWVELGAGIIGGIIVTAAIAGLAI